MNNNEIIVSEEEKNLQNHYKMVDNLSSLVSGLVTKLNLGDDLLNLVRSKITSRLVEDGDDEISTSSLIALIDILSKSDNANVNSLLGLLKENTKVVIENKIDTPNSNSNGSIPEMSADDVKKAKGMLDLFDNLKKMKDAEFTEEK